MSPFESDPSDAEILVLEMTASRLCGGPCSRSMSSAYNHGQMVAQHMAESSELDGKSFSLRSGPQTACQILISQQIHGILARVSL